MRSLPWVEAIKARVKKATPGPWVEFRDDWDGEPYNTVVSEGAEGAVVCTEPLDIRHYESCSICTAEGRDADNTFIAHAREDIPRLLRAVEVLGEAVVACAVPYEALLLDRQSRKWIAPEVWAAMERAVLSARRALADVREG